MTTKPDFTSQMLGFTDLYTTFHLRQIILSLNVVLHVLSTNALCKCGYEDARTNEKLKI